MERRADYPPAYNIGGRPEARGAVPEMAERLRSMSHAFVTVNKLLALS